LDFGHNNKPALYRTAPVKFVVGNDLNPS